VVELYGATLPLVAENLRVNERLVANGRATPDAALRARAERADVEQQLAAAEERAAAARRYVNLLLDRPLDDPLALLPDSAFVPAAATSLDASLASALARREELRQVTLGASAARTQARLASASFLPSVGAALDWGVQGNRYRLARDADFALATVSLQWNLFNGGQDVARRAQARLDEDRLLVQRRELERQIALEVRQAHEGAEVARRAVATADVRLVAAERAFQLVARRYAEGLSPLVEFLDARTAYTTAGLNRILSVYDALLRQVELSRAAALDELPLPTVTR
jgi:outer membrane protein TolC